MSEQPFRPRHREMPSALRQALLVQQAFMEERFAALQRQIDAKPAAPPIDTATTQKVWMLAGGAAVLSVLGMFLLMLWTGEQAEIRRDLRAVEIERKALTVQMQQLDRDLERLRQTIEPCCYQRRGLGPP